MSNIMVLILFTVLMFIIFVIARKMFGKNALFVIGIGSVIGANLYNANDFPIAIGNLVFGIDSIIYTLFVFSILSMYMEYGMQSMRDALYSAAGSILLTGLLAFGGYYFQAGITNAMILNFGSYFFSLIGTVVAIELMIWVYKKLNLKINIYLNIAIGLALASLVNSMIYYGLSFLFIGSTSEVFLQALIGSYIGKGFCIILCLLAFYIGKLWDKYTERKKPKTIEETYEI
ncbi:MAG: hypothetical protein PHX09_03300 [Clostridia bacterium]|nr:hypothetical protein [Clostridia bacterium]MDD4685934.1 hypothetical protein [Clostridia bacterium]